MNDMNTVMAKYRDTVERLTGSPLVEYGKDSFFQPIPAGSEIPAVSFPVARRIKCIKGQIEVMVGMVAMVLDPGDQVTVKPGSNHRISAHKSSEISYKFVGNLT